MGKPMRPMPIQPIFCALSGIRFLLRTHITWRGSPALSQTRPIASDAPQAMAVAVSQPPGAGNGSMVAAARRSAPAGYANPAGQAAGLPERRIDEAEIPGWRSEPPVAV